MNSVTDSACQTVPPIHSPVTGSLETQITLKLRAYVCFRIGPHSLYSACIEPGTPLYGCTQPAYNGMQSAYRCIQAACIRITGADSIELLMCDYYYAGCISSYRLNTTVKCRHACIPSGTPALRDQKQPSLFCQITFDKVWTPSVKPLSHLVILHDIGLPHMFVQYFVVNDSGETFVGRKRWL